MLILQCRKRGKRELSMLEKWREKERGPKKKEKMRDESGSV